MSATEIPTRPVTPKQYEIYEDRSGAHYVLTMDKRVLWFALKLGPTPSVVMLSTQNLQHMQLIGRATMER